jgi:hypothetical protein
MNDDHELLQENPTMPVPEYDMVIFEPQEDRWRNHLPAEREAEWAKKLPHAKEGQHLLISSHDSLTPPLLRFSCQFNDPSFRRLP